MVSVVLVSVMLPLEICVVPMHRRPQTLHHLLVVQELQVEVELLLLAEVVSPA